MRLTLPLGIVATMLLLAACEKSNPVQTSEAQIRVGATQTSLCPDQKTRDASVKIVATVFAKDGQVAPDQAVDFATSAGSLSEARVVSTAAGQAITTLTVPAGAGTVTVTATLGSGATSTATINVPTTPFVLFATNNSTPTKGVTFQLNTLISGACNVQRLAFDVSYDPTYFSFTRADENGFLNDSNGDGTPINSELHTDVSPDGTSGRNLVHVDYRRNDPAGTGRTSSSTVSVLSLVFDTEAEGSSNITVPRDPGVMLYPNIGPASYDLYPDPSDTTKDRVSPQSLTITIGAPAS